MMVRVGQHRRHGALLRALRASLVVGALYDLGFAAVMVVAPRLPERLFGLPQPGEAFYLWLIATFLTMLAAFYLFAAFDPVSYQGNIVVAIAGRTMGAFAMGLAAWLDPALGGLVPLAAADLLFAVVHAACWWPIRT